jgi:DNA repair exonuclease SbcCD ATPase subunit
MQIYLKRVKITNFKGIQCFESDFDHVTNIFGDNGTGKTTIMDGFLWLFFGKNSNDASKFEIKRLDDKNKFIKNLESEVSATIHIDGQDIVVRKVLRQKWVTRRGSTETDYSGDENIYFWNDVPMKESEFKVKIKAIVDEPVFKLITNPFYFNSVPWQDRRNTLISIAGEIDNNVILESLINGKSKPHLEELKTALGQNKSIDEFKREIAAKKKRIKDEAESIPSRIDEVTKGKPEERDFDAIRFKIDDLTQESLKLQKAIDDESALAVLENDKRTKLINEHHQKKTDRQNSIFSIKTEIQNIEFAAKSQASEAGNKLNADINSATRSYNDKVAEKDKYSSTLNSLKKDKETKLGELNDLKLQYQTIEASINDFNEVGFNNEIAGLEAQIEVKNQLIDNVAAEIERINSEELSFDNVDFSCPSCNQALPTDNIVLKKAELKARFNADKEDRLKEIKAKGNSAYDEIDNIEAKITAKRNERAHYAEVFNSNKSKKLNQLVENINAINAEITALDTRIINGTKVVSELEAEILVQGKQIESLKLEASLPAQTTEYTIKAILSTNDNYNGLVKKLADLESNPIEDLVFSPIASNEELKQKRNEATDMILELNKQLNDEDAIARANNRIQELQEQETKLVQELSVLEGTEFAILQFTKAKIEAMEAKLNGKFSMVKFKLFATQVNGGETECCETLINGVPFSDANNASRINAGIDIINALSRHYDVSAPIFIDNRESVVKLIDSESQIVNLIVMEGSSLSVGQPKIKKAA